MATIITKNSSTASAVPTNTQLVQGELAVNVTDKRLFTENASGTIVELGTNPSSLTLPNGTANGVAYLNGSKVLTSGSALVFDGTNFGIGTSSPASKLHVKSIGQAVTIEGTAARGSGNIYAAFSDPTGRKGYLGYGGGDDTLYLANEMNAPMIFITNNAERARIDASGNLGLGVTPSAWGVGIKVFEFGTKGGLAAAPSDVNFSYNTYYDGSNRYRTSDYANNFQMTGGAFKWYTAPSGTAGNAISFTQAMTLTNGGIWKLGTTGNGPYASVGVMSYDGSTNWSVGPYSGNPGGFLITANASYGVYLATTTSTSWATASDERVKTDLEPIADAAAKVATLRAVTGRYLADPTGPRKPFLIAQDVLAVLPEAVDTSNPEKYGLAYTEVIPLLVAAIKEQQAIINQLKARLDAANL